MSTLEAVLLTLCWLFVVADAARRFYQARPAGPLDRTKRRRAVLFAGLITYCYALAWYITLFR